MKTELNRTYRSIMVNKLRSSSTYLLKSILAVSLLIATFHLAPQAVSADSSLNAVATGTSPWAVAVNPVTNKIYVANMNSNNVTVIDGASNITTTVATGTKPQAITVNPVTNKIYVANNNSNNVTVIDGASNMTTTVAAGTNPAAIAVNTVTNKIYVANSNSANVTVIDGGNNTTTTVEAGNYPISVAVNPVTNKIYVANYNSANVTVIDGASNTTTTAAAGNYPISVAVNSVTNKIYVANYDSHNVTIIDGPSNTTTTVAVGSYPTAITANPVTNKIYVANSNSASVTVIDGASNTTTTVATGANAAAAVAVNPVTNKIYVANSNSANVTVIDGASNTTTTVAAGNYSVAVAVNPVTNKIYVANSNSNNVTVIDGASNTTTTIAAKTNPAAVEVNPVTNKIYVANSNSNNVTVIDGANNTTTTVEAGNFPWAVAVNPVTNKIYVANYNSANVTVIDGASNTTTTVAAGNYPISVAVNPVTNKIYVANYDSHNVTIIDGASNTTTTVAVGSYPTAITANPVTNKIYVANSNSASVTVIDGASNTTTTVATGTNAAAAVAVNPVTNKIYVANSNSANVTVIDGASNTTTTVAAGNYPVAVAVNPVTNKIYVANSNSNNVTVIDGASNTTTTIAAGSNPWAVEMNPVTNKIYVANSNSNNVTVIDGASNTTTVAAGTRPMAVAVNPVTNKIFVANSNSANVTVIDGAGRTMNPLQVGVMPLPGNIAYGTDEIFTFQVSNAYSPYASVVHGVYFQLDTTEGTWVRANPSGGDWTGMVSSITYGQHELYVLALEAQEVVVPAGVAAYSFTVLPDYTISPASASFDKYAGAAGNADVSTTLTLNGNTLTSIANGATTLAQGTDYTVSGSTVTINKAYLAAQPVGTTSLTFTFSSGAAQTLAITVSDTTPQTSTISPASASFDKYAGAAGNADVSTTLTLNGNTLTSIANGATPLAQGTDYTVSGSTVTINKAYLAAQPVGTTSLTFTFSGGAAQTLAIMVSDTTPQTSTISPTSASFDKYAGAAGNADVSTTLTLNGNTLTSIANGATPLAQGTDYTVSGSTVTINKAYLAAQPVGTTSLTFTFSSGAAQTLAITVSDTTPQTSTISPTSASFDKYAGAAGNADVSTTLTLNGNTLTSIANGATTLAQGTDYSVSGSTVTINKAYLAAQPVGTTSLTFTFSGGAAQTLAITVSDTTPAVSNSGSGSTPAVINPVIDINGSAVDPDSVDTTKPSVVLEVSPKDGVAYVSIPASILTGFAGKNADFFIEIKTHYGSYQVPVNIASLIPGLQELLDANNIKAEDVSFKITMTDKSGNKDIQAAFKNSVPNGIVKGAIVDFHIVIINTKTGKTIGSADRFSKSLTRVIPMPKDRSSVPVQWGAFRYNEMTKKFEFVPARMVQIDGVWYALIASNSNSVYVVAENAVNFTDVLKHWGKSYVDLAAAKGLVDGVGGGKYDPNRTITRAEFTAMLVRSLGRGTSIGNTSSYDDVKSGAWYFEEVAKAKELGLLNFVSGNSFKPDQPLTREEMASMLAAVIALEKLPMSKEFVSLDGYKDIGSVNAAYLEDVRLMVKLNIMTGTDTNTFSPKGETTRAQAAVVFIRMLQAFGMTD
ncbi:X2-like carbohydrate binding domain-containing protein [Paenibacillus sp. LHD-117]|uniref:X2-like carbohydrate binding domain-containing protein n=1 Tax=Paenibacillus sp. LHD-117 TaxID=3071412 RepID=UPI0027DF1EC7|nr:X2-like carbohydrate binding domain-containing protein [Paenibacillus sp. LHD-117]MDQ6420513.1 X2-like carbohydrate binding domain-containing protein [Paenibacillus sp. LHD-117]